MAKSSDTDENDMKAKEAKKLAEAQAESKTDQKLAAIKAEENAAQAVKSGVDAKTAAAGARMVKVLVKTVPNNGIVSLNNQQIRIAKVNDVMNLPYAYYAAFPSYFVLIEEDK